jgi:hypothetical protein
MGAAEERKTLERLSQAWRRITTGGKGPPAATPSPPALPPAQTPSQSPPAA